MIMKDVEVTVMRFDPQTDDEPKYETFQIEAKKYDGIG